MTKKPENRSQGKAFGRHPDSKQVVRMKVRNDLLTPNKVPRKIACGAMPIINRKFRELDHERSIAFLVLCKIGEKARLSTAQYLVINRIFHDRLLPLSFEEWLIQLLEAGNNVMRDRYMEASQAAQVFNSFEDDKRDVAKEEFKDIQRALYEDQYALHCLMKVRPRMVTWDRLVEIGLKPKTASFYLMRVRPCEHVCLSNTMLAWAQEVPEILHPGRYTDEGEPSYAPIPSIAPRESGEYQDIEYRVRRRQRAYFSGFTSLECEGLISGSMQHWLH